MYPKAIFQQARTLAAAALTGVLLSALSLSAQAYEFDLESKTVTLNSGFKMPIVGLGTYALSDEECHAVVSTLLDNGGRLIDTATVYGTETAVGEAVRASKVPRSEVFVTTKLYPNEFASAREALEDSLKRLDLEYIDLVLLHHPRRGDVEAYKVLEQAVREGKVRSIGLSNWYIEELEDFLPQVSITPAVVQNEIHPYYQEKEVVAYIQDKDIVVNGYSPFGGRGHTQDLFSDPVIKGIAAAHQVTPAQVVLRWNIQRGVIVIPGTENPDYVRENLDIFDFALTKEEMDAIAALDRNEKHEWY